MTVLRPASDADVDTCLMIQRASTTVGYAHIFDQVLYPFPERAIRGEWVSRFARHTAVTIAAVADSAAGPHRHAHRTRSTPLSA